MDWLNQVFEEQSLAWLLITSGVALVSGFLSSWLIYRYVKRPEIIDQTTLQGKVRKEVEDFLGERSAQREYDLEARKRLYHAIGPLRFQLVLACRDAAVRLGNLRSKKTYSLSISGYYGRNTLYRLLRPLAIAELIEQQITYADFSVDITAIDLLRFKRAIATALTDGAPILEHPNVNWDAQVEHLFAGTLDRLANSLIIPDENANNKKRPMHFHEFEDLVRTPKNQKQFAPLTYILENFTPTSKPIFWVRLVCFGCICNEYLGRAGSAIGFERQPFDLHRLLQASEDAYILSNIERYVEAIRSLADVPASGQTAEV